MSDAAVEISYSTTASVKRTGVVGRILGWLGAHPIWGGFLCGLLVVVIAGLRSPGGVISEPATAALLSAVVIGAWMGLFFMMRSFFEDQSYQHHQVLRRIVMDDEEARWEQDGAILRRVVRPQIKLFARPVPDDAGQDGDLQAWPVWIVVTGEEQERLIIETRDSAERARRYEAVSEKIVDESDEQLPRALVVPLMSAATPGSTTS